MFVKTALLCGIAVRLFAAAPPRVDYVTYLGGSFVDSAVGIAVDSTGSSYVAGTTVSPDFPVTSTSLGTPSLQGCAFITKLNPSGTAIDFSVCLANSGATAFALDAGGNIYLATGDGVVKLNPAAQNILYKTSIDSAYVESLSLDATGNVYVTGTAGPGLATTPGAYQVQSAGGQCRSGRNGTGQCGNAFIAKLSASGGVVWATYLGGLGPDDAHAIGVDNAGNVWVAGETVSPNFPTSAGAVSRTFGGEIDLGPLRFGDAFVAKLDPTGSHLLYSTYLGGSAADAAFGLAVDAAGAVYVAGGTGSLNFPTTPGALQTSYTGYNPSQPPSAGPDGFVTKLGGSGNLIYSTLTGSTNAPIVVDASGQAYVSEAGEASPSMIQTTCAPPPTKSVLILNAAGSALAGTSPIPGGALALDGKGGLYSGGSTYTLVFFATPRAFQTEYGGGDRDAFAAKVDFSQLPGPALASLLNAATLFPGFATQSPTGAVAPGEIVTLFGSGLGSTKPTVNFNQYPAAVLYSSDCQINAVVPFEVNPGYTTLVTVQSGNQLLGPIKLPVAVAAPGIFTINERGTGQGAILNQDSSANSPANPAAPGSIVSIYATGTGPLNPSPADGALGPLTPPFPAPEVGVSATVGGVNSFIVFAGQAPGLIAGVTQINLQIPQDAPTGDAVPIIIYAGNYPSLYNQPVTLAVR
jgi:uncharacterized protein (TIGR03437 family)